MISFKNSALLPVLVQSKACLEATLVISYNTIFKATFISDSSYNWFMERGKNQHGLRLGHCGG
jgi:hypothetical protein